MRIPTTVLPVSGRWKVHLAAGLANAAGTEFQTVPLEDGGLPGRTNAYNATFRSYQQESELVCPSEQLPVSGLATELAEGLAVEDVETNHVPVAECGEHVDGDDQANTLAAGDVSNTRRPSNGRSSRRRQKRRNRCRPDTRTAGMSRRCRWGKE